MVAFKQELFDQLARIGKAVGQGHRLALLEYLAQGERSVEALAQLSGLSVANTSKHLQLMRHGGGKLVCRWRVVDGSGFLVSVVSQRWFVESPL